MKLRALSGGICVCLLLFTSMLFAGTEWEARTTSVTGGKESTVLLRAYAQDGNVREEFIEAKGSESTGMKKGMYILYLSGQNKMLVVDPKEKSYMEMDMNALGQLANNQVMEIKITNPKVTVEKLAPETVGTYQCRHIKIISSYDMETKVLFVKSKTHIEQTMEVWGTDAITLDDFNKNFLQKGVLTSIKELDALLQKQAKAYQDLGFVIKSVMTQTSTDLSDKKSKPQTTTSEMVITKINQKNLKAELFQVPANYKKVETELPPEAEAEAEAEAEKQKKEKTKEPKLDGAELLKGLFGN